MKATEETHERVNDTEVGNEMRDDKIEALQNKVNGLEQKDRQGNLIMTGLEERENTPGKVTIELIPQSHLGL